MYVCTHVFNYCISQPPVVMGASLRCDQTFQLPDLPATSDVQDARRTCRCTGGCHMNIAWLNVWPITLWRPISMTDTVIVFQTGASPLQVLLPAFWRKEMVDAFLPKQTDKWNNLAWFEIGRRWWANPSIIKYHIVLSWFEMSNYVYGYTVWTCHRRVILETEEERERKRDSKTALTFMTNHTAETCVCQWTLLRETSCNDLLGRIITLPRKTSRWNVLPISPCSWPALRGSPANEPKRHGGSLTHFRVLFGFACVALWQC